jgi:hypothetical protein
MKRIFVALASVLLLCVAYAFSQTSAVNSPTLPHLIRFSGSVADNNGATVGMTFAIYKDPSGGPSLWQEVQNVTIDADGHYTVLLGAVTAGGIPAEIFSSNEARWLGVQIEQNPEQPRVVLVSVPYALKASDTDTLGGRPASAYVLAPNPATGKMAGDAGSPAAGNDDIEQRPINGLGTPGFLAKFLQPRTVGNSAIFESGGLVGIGTTQPTQVLDLAGNLKLNGTGRGIFFPDGSFQASAAFGTITGVKSGPGITGGGTSGNLTLSLDTAFTDARYLQPTGDGSGLTGVNAAKFGGLPPSAFAQAGAASNFFVGGVAFGGNVGIGTLTPSARLEVAGNMRVSGVGSTLTVGGNVLVTGTSSFGAPDGTLTVIQGGADTAATFSCASGSPIGPPPDGGFGGCLPVRIKVNNGQEALSVMNNTGLTGEVASIDASGVFTGSALKLPPTTSAYSGVLDLGGAPFAHAFGVANTFVGAGAGNFTMQGELNTAIGADAFSKDTTGTSNTAVGTGALYYNSSGIGNTAFGVGAGGSVEANANSTGSSNTFVGFQSGVASSTQLNNATAIGANALVGCNNCIVLGDSAQPMMVGIRTDTPTEAFELMGNAKISGAGNGLIFPDGSVQTTAAKGGGSGGGVTSVGTGLGLTGGTIISSGTLSIDTSVVPQLGAPSNNFTGNLAAGSFSGNGSGLLNVNAATLGGMPPSAFAITGSNSFVGDQGIKGNLGVSGSLSLPTTTGATSGVLTLGGVPYLFGGTGFPVVNSFFGGAGNFNVSGGGNTGTGLQALTSLRDGNFNTAYGAFALKANAEAYYNTAFGAYALSSTIGAENTATGYEALFSNAAGASNTASGFDALYSNTTGRNNIAIGTRAGGRGTINANTTGSNNTFLGFQSGPGVPTEVDNAAAIGANALVNCSNCIVLGDSAQPMMVGIRTNTPTQAFEVMGNAKIGGAGNGLIFPDGSVQTTAATGSGGGSGTVTSVGSGLGLTGGTITTSGTLSIDTGVVPQLGAASNVFSGNITAGSFTGSGTGLINVNAATLGGMPPGTFAQVGAASNTFSGNATFGGNVGVGTQTPSARFEVAGDMRVSGAASTLTVGGNLVIAGTSGANGSIHDGTLLLSEGGGDTAATIGCTLGSPSACLPMKIFVNNGQETLSIQNRNSGAEVASIDSAGVLTPGGIHLPPSGTASATQGFTSNFLDAGASAFNPATGTAETQDFRVQVDPINNGQPSRSGQLSLLFGQGGAVPSATGLSVASNGIITFAPGQTFPGGGGGSITAVNTPAGGGLMGGGNSGALNLSLLNSCALGQVLQWTGSAWTCATVSSNAGVTSVASGLGLMASPNPIISSGTISIDPAVVPQLTGSAVNNFANRQNLFCGTPPCSTTTFFSILGPASNPGDFVRIDAGKMASGTGAAISVTSGAGADSSTTFGSPGGSLSLLGGSGGNSTAAGSNGGSGGTVTIQGGAGGTSTSSSAGGGARISANGGFGSSGGALTLVGGGAATLATGGSVTLNGGTGTTGGGVLIQGGNSPAAGTGTGGIVTIQGGAGSGSGIVSLASRVGINNSTPAQALDVAGNVKITNIGNGVIFADGSKQTVAGLTSVNTLAGSGLIGGGNTSPLTLSLLNTCASGQVLQWSGSAWVCATVSSAAGVTRVAAGQGLIAGPNPIISSGTLAIDTSLVPLLTAPNTFTTDQTINGSLTIAGASGSGGVDGNLNLPATIASAGVINIGFDSSLNPIPFAHSFGTNNSFLGTNAGNLTTTGTGGNTGIGANALSALSTGNSNTAVGANALSANNTGNQNTAVGQLALRANTSGVYNEAVGNAALNANTMGYSNAAFGGNALVSNATGFQNTAVGNGAGTTAVAGNANTTGSNNTFVGYNSGPASPTQLTDATAIGANALVGCSDCIVLGDSTAQIHVGIGTNTPFATLEVNGILQVNKSITLQGGLNGPAGVTPVSLPSGLTTTTLVASGNVTAGSFSANSKAFKIDHPLDPERKYLSHSSVESPDMKNIYDGVATLDADGQAWVELPSYFEALNKDFRYQLTAIGAPAPNLYIAQEVRGNRFHIAGGKPGGKVSWQVTGIRQDAYAKKHRIEVEEDKPAEEQGSYLSPDSFGQPEEKGIAWARAHRDDKSRAPSPATASNSEPGGHRSTP